MSLMSVIFSNVYDENLKELTEYRTMGSLPTLARYRLIDFVLSNAVNSGITNIGIITKQNYQSLMDHLGNGMAWDLDRKKGGLYILPPFGTKTSFMYKGKLEALYGAIKFLEHSSDEYVLLADSNIICNIDYNKVLKFHKKNKADITVVCKTEKMDKEEQSNKNVLLYTDKSGRINNVLINYFVEGKVLCGLNMYIIKRSLLLELIKEAHSLNNINLEKNIIQDKYKDLKIYAYEFKGYTAKIDSIRSYFLNSLEFLSSEIRDEVFNSDRPIYTKILDDTPIMYKANANVSNSLIADGCVIDGNVINSILFRGVKVKKGAFVKNSIVMQSSEIGENANIEYCIIDKDSVINDSRLLVGIDKYPVVIKKGCTV